MVFIPVVWLYKYILLVYRQHNNSVNDKLLTLCHLQNCCVDGKPIKYICIKGI
jgi:hypothetical protein